MDELKYCKICSTGWIEICQVTRLAWVSLYCGLFLESPELNVPSGSSFKTNAIVQPFIKYAVRLREFKGDSRFAREFEKFVKIVLFPGTFLRYRF